jgi:hypothetical protein
MSPESKKIFIDGTDGYGGTESALPPQSRAWFAARPTILNRRLPSTLLTNYDFALRFLHESA